MPPPPPPPRCAVRLSRGAWAGRLPSRGAVRVDALESCPGTVAALQRKAPLPPGVATLVLLCPGNPGVVDFYADFALELAFRCPGAAVVVLGLLGHTAAATQPASAAEQPPYDLQQQTELFHDALASAVFDRGAAAPPRRVVVAGHSIGGYVALQMAARFPGVARALLLAPTVAEMAASPSGRSAVLRLCLSPPGTALLAAAAAPLRRALPGGLRRLLLSAVEPRLSGAQLEAALAVSGDGAAVRNVLSLARSELAQIAAIDAALLGGCAVRLVLYFVPDDGWVPTELARRVAAAAPGAVVLFERRQEVAHAWCCGASALVAAAVAPYVTLYGEAADGEAADGEAGATGPGQQTPPPTP